MSAAEVIAEIESLPETECVRIAEAAFQRLKPDDLKLLDRKLRRLANPDIPEEVWQGFEDCEDGYTVDMETALREDPPPWVLDRSPPRPK